MDEDGRKEYRSERYAKRKESMNDKMLALHSWLAVDAVRDIHCFYCVGKPVKPADKLSLGTYGPDGVISNPNRVEVRACPLHFPRRTVTEAPRTSIPPDPLCMALRQDHGNDPKHLANVKAEKLKQSGAVAAGSASTGILVLSATARDDLVYNSITPQDELFTRTIRTVHLIAKRQLSLNDMYHLLELQWANGAMISFDHRNVSGEIETGGVAAWLEAGARVFQSEQRERAQSSLVKVLFPRGAPIGWSGDGSNDISLREQEVLVTRHLGGDGYPFNSLHDLALLDLENSQDKHSPEHSPDHRGGEGS
jgi:hypothetical protein